MAKHILIPTQLCLTLNSQHLLMHDQNLINSHIIQLLTIPELKVNRCNVVSFSVS